MTGATSGAVPGPATGAVPGTMSRTIRSMVALVVRCADPDEVLLFGSQAKGTGGVDSDVDLLVLHDTPRAHALGHELAELLGRYPVAVDVHVLSRAAVVSRWQDRGSFTQSILSTARSVHLRRGRSVLEELAGHPANRLRRPAAGA